MLAIGNLLRYMYAKNYQNIAWCDKVIAKIKWCSFLTYMVHLDKQKITISVLVVSTVRRL